MVTAIQRWIRAEGKRNADLSQARIELVVWQGYEDGWDILGAATSMVPILLHA